MEDVKSGKWIPRKDLKFPVNSPLIEEAIFDHGGDNFDIVEYCVEYTRRLESKGRFQLCIWPEHCLIGTEGHNVVDNVRLAMEFWSRVTGGSVEWVHKGENLLTEMYSALSAEVPLNKGTDFNFDLLDSVGCALLHYIISHECTFLSVTNLFFLYLFAYQCMKLKKSEKLIVCGQAMSHCVNYTVRDIVEHWPKEEMGKITLLKDCASSVPGFDAAGKTFISDMTEAGVNVDIVETFKI